MGDHWKPAFLIYSKKKNMLDVLLSLESGHTLRSLFASSRTSRNLTQSTATLPVCLSKISILGIVRSMSMKWKLCLTCQPVDELKQKPTLSEPFLCLHWLYLFSLEPLVPWMELEWNFCPCVLANSLSNEHVFNVIFWKICTGTDGGSRIGSILGEYLLWFGSQICTIGNKEQEKLFKIPVQNIAPSKITKI